MKKYFKFFAPAMALILFSCSREALEETGNAVPLVFSTGIDVQTKGAGPLDSWKEGQQLFVYGIPRIESESGESSLDFNNRFIDNVAAAAPVIGNSIQVFRTGNEYYYYAEGSRYDFFAYFADDARLGIPSISSTGINRAVTIDGTQDIMCAVADRSRDAAGTDVDPSRLYSAYSARRGIVPKLEFKHQLSRFNIYVKNTDGLAPKVTIKSFDVQSYSTATLEIARSSAALGSGLNYEGAAAPAWFSILSGDFQLTSEKTALGSVLVMPGQSTYDFRYSIVQEGYTAEETVNSSFTLDFSKLQISGEGEKDSVATPGHSYNVTVTIYGLQQVDIEVSLTEWKDAGEFEIDPDND